MNQHELLEQFKTNQNVVRNQTNNTAITYAYDAGKYLHFLSVRHNYSSAHVPFSKQLLTEYVYYLRTTAKQGPRQKALKDNSIIRHIHGVIAFWNFCYGRKLSPKPLKYEDLELPLRKTLNPTIPLSKKEYRTFMELIHHELNTMV